MRLFWGVRLNGGIRYLNVWYLTTTTFLLLVSHCPRYPVSRETSACTLHDLFHFLETLFLKCATRIPTSHTVIHQSIQILRLPSHHPHTHSEYTIKQIEGRQFSPCAAAG